MGLADRFKDKLETKNIFEKKGIEQSLAVNNIQFISKPITDNTLSQQKTARQGQKHYRNKWITIKTFNNKIWRTGNRNYKKNKEYSILGRIYSKKTRTNDF